MDTIELNASKRTVRGSQVKRLRREGWLPGVIYGMGAESMALQLDMKEVSRTISRLGSSTLIDLVVDGKTHKVLLKEIQRDVIRRTPIHVDFLEVALDVRIKAVVPIELLGESPAVRDLAAVLVQAILEVEVEALPMDLPDRLSVDQGLLEEMDSIITIADLGTVEGVSILNEPENVIARVTYQIEEEEEEEEILEEELIEGMEPEVIDRGDDEEAGEEEASEEPAE
jgi:large subunit ribosomal protein L25